jgi:uncharacterized protein (DUF58 family)
MELLRRVRRLEIRTRGLVDRLFSGEYASVFKGQGVEFHEVRPYVPGDDVRAIDWNVTARTGYPYVKTFVETRELSVLLLVDISPSTLFGTPGHSKRELMAEIASLLVFSALRSRDQVGLVLFSDRVEKVLLPRKGRRHGLRVLREILETVPEGSGTELAGPMEAVGRMLRRRTILFLMSDFQVPEPAEALKPLAARHDLIPVVLEDPREEDCPDLGLLELEDLETGQRLLLDTSQPAVRRRWRERARSRWETLRRDLGRLGLDVVWLRTDADPARALQAFFSQRLRRRAGSVALRAGGA